MIIQKWISYTAVGSYIHFWMNFTIFCWTYTLGQQRDSVMRKIFLSPRSLVQQRIYKSEEKYLTLMFVIWDKLWGQLTIEMWAAQGRVLKEPSYPPLLPGPKCLSKMNIF